MFYKNSFLTFVTVVLFLGLSCNKQSINDNNTLQNYEMYGQYHNSYVKMMLLRKAEKADLSFSQAYKQLRQNIALDFGIDTTEVPSFSEVQELITDYIDTTKVFDNIARDSSLNISKEEKNYFDKIDSIIQRDLSAELLEIEMESLSADIAADANLGLSEKELLQVSTSIAKYSYELWKDNYHNLEYFPWGTVIADVAGGVVGFIAIGDVVGVIASASAFSYYYSQNHQNTK